MPSRTYPPCITLCVTQWLLARNHHRPPRTSTTWSPAAGVMHRGRHARRRSTSGTLTSRALPAALPVAQGVARYRLCRFIQMSKCWKVSVQKQFRSYIAPGHHNFIRTPIGTRGAATPNPQSKARMRGMPACVCSCRVVANPSRSNGSGGRVLAYQSAATPVLSRHRLHTTPTGARCGRCAGVRCVMCFRCYVV